MSSLQTYDHFKLDFQKVNQHTVGKWLINDTKPRKDNKLQAWISSVMQIKYGLPYCVNCPSMSTDPGWWDPGIRTNTGAGDTVLEKYT